MTKSMMLMLSARLCVKSWLCLKTAFRIQYKAHALNTPGSRHPCPIAVGLLWTDDQPFSECCVTILPEQSGQVELATMTSAGTRKRPAPAGSEWTEATFSVKRKTKKNRDRAPVRLIENWCRPCISRLVQDPNHRCSNQTEEQLRLGEYDTGPPLGAPSLPERMCADTPKLPKVAIPAAKAALAAAEAVEDKDEDSLHVFTTAATKARRVVLANPKNRKGNPPSKSATVTATTNTRTISAGDGVSEWGAELLELGRRFVNLLEAMQSAQSAHFTRQQDYEDDDDRDEDGDYDG
ncbi:hypothetical protein BJ166DRAFT_617470 [Pestalotiopsis sp. NC0098]|nr:hypothetical protein BJ166DRAFT_617470 [Pestalotiopsis sp. NC0098]